MNVNLLFGVTGGALLLLGALIWMLYERFMHPAWRTERRLIRACEKAFEEDDYRLIRLRITPGTPSTKDVMPRPIGPPEMPRYFTYTIEAKDPDFSGMSRSEVGLVRRYLHRHTGGVPHHGRTVIHPKSQKEDSTYRLQHSQ